MPYVQRANFNTDDIPISVLCQRHATLPSDHNCEKIDKTPTMTLLSVTGQIYIYAIAHWEAGCEYKARKVAESTLYLAVLCIGMYTCGIPVVLWVFQQLNENVFGVLKSERKISNQSHF
jgi:hypothetical protein